ncbi:MAG: DUF1844 domain-containing protein [Verrucomicrobiota bacterium]|nr:DUF1844 domain-containing protein [Verrucomicrobiota bacterium]
MQDDTGIIPDDGSGPKPSPEEFAAALFAETLLTQARTAMMLLGKGTHPAIGEPITDVIRARKLIDQLEVLEAKPDGLGAEETRLIRESLHELRMAFVEAVGDQPSPESNKSETKTQAPSPSTTEPTGASKSDEGRKRFVKKYD